LSENEVLIKSKKRVQQHGEVFTPREIVDAMVTLPGLKDSIVQVSTTVLEPSVGEGAFLINILERRLQALASQYSEDLVRFENHALLAISSLYGIELWMITSRNAPLTSTSLF
jgi:type I restriction-modification system DNA methylase subunit